MKSRYISIKNSDGKEWIFALDNLQIGLNIYQASSTKGILLKKYLPILIKVPGLNSILIKSLGMTYSSLDVPNSVIYKIKEVFNVTDPSFAYFAGTPSKHKKGVIQVSFNDKLLGYVKITGKKAVADLFYSEQLFLTWLNECGINNIPTCLFCGKIEGLYIFAQNTIKTGKSCVLHSINDTQIDFLKKMNKCTKIKCTFEESDYYKSLNQLKKNQWLISHYGVQCRYLNRGFNIIEEKLKNQSEYSAYHGDFTPWNSFVEEGELYVFDFEYAKRTYPPFIDIFHFFTQSCIFEQKLDAIGIFNKFLSEKKRVFDRLFDQPEISYLEYIYSIIAFYFDRDGDSLKADDIRNLQYWIKLIDLLVDRICDME